MNSHEEDCLQHRNVRHLVKQFPGRDSGDSGGAQLTLLEEVLLLGLKDQDGYISFWNDSISYGLRASILIELSFANKIVLEAPCTRRKSLVSRKIIVQNDSPLDDAVIDETLKTIKQADGPESVECWIEYLSGESWNPLKFKYHLRNVKERLAKNLVEKGVVSTSKKNYFLFDIVTHPLVNDEVKNLVIKKIQDALLDKYVNDIKRMDKRTLALILMAFASDVLEAALASLNEDEYELASKRIRDITGTDFEDEARKADYLEILGAAFLFLNT